MAVLRQSNSHGRTGTESSPALLRDEVERSTASVKRLGKNISQPLANLDLGQSVAEPTPMAVRRGNRQINKGRQPRILLK